MKFQKIVNLLDTTSGLLKIYQDLLQKKWTEFYIQIGRDYRVNKEIELKHQC